MLIINFNAFKNIAGLHCNFVINAAFKKNQHIYFFINLFKSIFIIIHISHPLKYNSFKQLKIYKINFVDIFHYFQIIYLKNLNLLKPGFANY